MSVCRSQQMALAQLLESQDVISSLSAELALLKERCRALQGRQAP